MANPDVFISYSSQDRARVEPIAAKLSDRKLNVWWDRDLQVGASFRDVIQGMLRAARAVVVFWSQSSIQSQWVIDEAEEAVKRGILIPARLDEVNAPMGLRGWHYADMFHRNGKSDTAIRLLVEAVVKLVNLGVRPEPRWWSPMSDSAIWSINGADVLGRLSLDVRGVATLLSADADATAALKTSVNEVYRTYAAVRDAVDAFGEAQGPKGIRRRRIQAIAKGRLAVEVNARRGHCTAIGLAYFGHPGIRDALVRSSVAELATFDQAFSSLSTADGDAFQAMTAITETMAGEAAAILNHLAAGQEAVARARLSEDISQLRMLEAKLNEHMTSLLAFAGEFGIQIDDVS